MEFFYRKANGVPDWNSNVGHHEKLRDPKWTKIVQVVSGAAGVRHPQFAGPLRFFIEVTEQAVPIDGTLMKGTEFPVVEGKRFLELFENNVLAAPNPDAGVLSPGAVADSANALAAVPLLISTEYSENGHTINEIAE